MNEDNEDRAMALREVRFDIDHPLKLVDAFMGVGLHSKYESGEVNAVIVNGASVPFTVERITLPIETTALTDCGYATGCVRAKVIADGLYGEKLELEFVYTKVKDKIYKQERPELATVEVKCVNRGTLKFPPDEIFVMCSAKFKDI